MKKTIISAGSKLDLNLSELWHYRELLIMLAYRDIRVRYAQTFLGLSWAIIQPLVATFIFIMIFNKAAKVSSDPVPYILFTFTGMLAWNYFSFILTQSSSSLVTSQNMITKIYFPRLIIPFSKIISGGLDFIIVFVVTLVIFLLNFYPISANVIYLPFAVLALIFVGLTIGIMISALTIRFRDFQHVTPYMIQLGMFISPVAYPLSIIPEKYILFYYYNPVANVIEAFRYCFLGNSSIPIEYFVINFIVLTVVFILALFYFKKIEKVLVDII